MSFRVLLFGLIVEAKRELEWARPNMSAWHIQRAYVKGLERALELYEKQEGMK